MSVVVVERAHAQPSRALSLVVALVLAWVGVVVVDLGITASPSTFNGASGGAEAAAVLPASSGEPLRLPTAGAEVSMQLPGAPVAGDVHGDHATYPQVLTGADLEVAVFGPDAVPGVASAVQTLVRIEGPQAPRSFSFGLSIPAGSELVLQPDGSATVLDRTGRLLGAFAMPWAIDAAGKRLPTSFRIENGSLVQDIDHRGATYPVVADPFWVVPVLAVGGRLVARMVVSAAARRAAREVAVALVHEHPDYTDVELTSRRPAPTSMKAFTRRNLRHNLSVYTHRTRLGYDAHHRFPVKFEQYFTRRNINIHRPENAMWWCARPHRAMANEYNRDWQSYWDRVADGERSGTRSDVVQQEQRIYMKKRYLNSYRCTWDKPGYRRRSLTLEESAGR